MQPNIWFPFCTANPKLNTGTDTMALTCNSKTLSSSDKSKIGQNSYTSYSDTSFYAYVADTTSDFVNKYINNRNFSFGCWISSGGTSNTGTILEFAGASIILDIKNVNFKSYIEIKYYVSSVSFYTLQSSEAMTLDLLLTWTHVFFTKDLSSNTLKLYINGKLDNTRVLTGANILSAPNSGNFLNLFYTTFSKSITDGFYINDLRIYDSCLTEKEIYNISRAMFAHYPLNETECTEPNLVSTPTRTGTVFVDNDYVNKDRNYDILTVTDYGKVYTEIIGGWTLGANINNTSTRCIPHFVNLNGDIAMKFPGNSASLIYSISDYFYIKSDDNSTSYFFPRTYNITISFDACTTNKNAPDKNLYIGCGINNVDFYQKYITVKNTNWETISDTSSINFENSRGKLKLNLCNWHADAYKCTTYIKNVKLTTSDNYVNITQAPGYSNIIHDRSGYGRDISINNVYDNNTSTKLARLADAPFYELSITLLKTAYIEGLYQGPSCFKQMTINFWCKCNGLISTKGISSTLLFNMGILTCKFFYVMKATFARSSGSYLQCNLNLNNETYGTATIEAESYNTFILNQFNMITITCDIINNEFKLYVNGIMVYFGDISGTADMFYIPSNTDIKIFPNNSDIAYPFSFSDFRFYTSLLSDNDILELYKNNGIYYAPENKHIYCNTKNYKTV